MSAPEVVQLESHHVPGRRVNLSRGVRRRRVVAGGRGAGGIRKLSPAPWHLIRFFCVKSSFKNPFCVVSSFFNPVVLNPVCFNPVVVNPIG